MTIPEYIEIVTHWCQLKHLKYLGIRIRSEYNYPAEILIVSIVANNPTIEALGFSGFHHDFEKKKTIPALLKLKQLNDLVFISFEDNYIPINKIIELIKGLPALKAIMFYCGTIGISEINNILECRENLTDIKI